MERKRSIGVTLFVALYLFYTLLLLPNAAKSLISLGYSILKISSPAPGNYLGGPGLFLLALVGAIANTIPMLFIVILSIGLYRLSNIARIFMIIINCVFTIFVISFLYALTQPYKAINASLFYRIAVIGLLILFISSTYFFTRPKVKAQFKPGGPNA